MSVLPRLLPGFLLAASLAACGGCASEPARALPPGNDAVVPIRADDSELRLPVPIETHSTEAGVVVDLVRADWTRDGHGTWRQAADEERDLLLVHLAMDGQGNRWSTAFSLASPLLVRVYLDYEPGPGGVLFEIVLDGEKLAQPRRGWRPSRRRLVADCGPRFVGAGEHLLEFVAREERSVSSLRLAELLLEPLAEGP